MLDAWLDVALWVVVGLWLVVLGGVVTVAELVVVVDAEEESEKISSAADVDPMISPLPESYTTDASELGTCATTSLLLSDITELPTNISPLAESYAMP